MINKDSENYHKYTKYSEIFRTISHPLRLKILDCLLDQELSVSEIGEKSGISQPSLSQHLGVMRNGSALNFRRESKKIYYSINKKYFDIALDFLKNYID